MSGNYSFDLRLEQFQKAADRAFAYSKREGKVYMREQVRGVIRELFILTPPNRGSITGVKAKKVGEIAIQSDVRKVFRISNKTPEVTTISEMNRIMKDNRKPRKIRTVERKIKIKVTSRTMQQYIIKKKKQVGYLASAWAMAAQQVGSVRVPQWIKRHSAPGSSTIKEVPDGISASITNAVEWADSVYGLRGRINAALQKQTRKINNKTRDFYKKIGREF